jgi:hypothetical protein
VNLGANSLTFANVPDVPLGSLTLDITGPSAGKAFTTTCTPSKLAAKFTPQDGNPAQTVSAPITFRGCPTSGGATPGKPTASGSLVGLARGRPKLKLSATHGTNAPNLSSVSVRVSSGLSFSRRAVARKCTGKGKHKKCRKSIKGLSVSGGAIKSATVNGGRLTVTLKHAAPSVSIAAGGPLLVESKALRRKAKKHKAGTVAATVVLTDATGNHVTVFMRLKAS